MNTNKFALYATIIGAFGGIAAFLTYLQNRKGEKLKSDVLMLDKQIKQLELTSKKNQINV